MFDINSSIVIYTPIKKVFEFVSKPENDFQWQYGTLASNLYSGEIISVGSLFRSIGHVIGHRNISTFEVTEYEINRKYGFRSLSGPLDLQTAYTFEMGSGGTKVNISTRIHSVNSILLNEGGIEKKMKKQLKENLALLKELLEAKRITVTDSLGLKVNRSV